MPEPAPHGMSPQPQGHLVPPTTATAANGTMRNNARTRAYHAPGMRRVRLVLWMIYNRTPLHQVIDEQAERAGAVKCKLAWPDYLALKAAHPDLWLRAAGKRAKAQSAGRFPPQPHQLWRWRTIHAGPRAKRRRERPLLTEWAARKLLRQRTYKATWKRHMVLNRLILRMLGL
jgi:hypothetical protein